MLLEEVGDRASFFLRGVAFMLSVKRNNPFFDLVLKHVTLFLQSEVLLFVDVSVDVAPQLVVTFYVFTIVRQETFKFAIPDSVGQAEDFAFVVFSRFVEAVDFLLAPGDLVLGVALEFLDDFGIVLLTLGLVVLELSLQLGGVVLVLFNSFVCFHFSLAHVLRDSVLGHVDHAFVDHLLSADSPAFLLDFVNFGREFIGFFDFKEVSVVLL